MKEKNINVRVPEELHKEFKKMCVENGESLQDVIIELVKGYVELENEVIF